MGSAQGAAKTAARRVGCSLPEYQAKVSAGLKWCTAHQAWHPRVEFGRDASRADGLASACSATRNDTARARYTPRPRPEPGRRYVEARHEDRRQARRRVNYLVEQGLIPRPNDLPCTDCGHVWKRGQRRHEYDHYLGYAPEHHEDVQPVCTTCHHRRETDRGETVG